MQISTCIPNFPITVVNFLEKTKPSSINTRINIANSSERLGFILLGKTNTGLTAVKENDQG